MGKVEKKQKLKGLVFGKVGNPSQNQLKKFWIQPKS